MDLNCKVAWFHLYIVATEEVGKCLWYFLLYIVPFVTFLFFNREFILCCFWELSEVLIGVAIKGCI